MAYWPIEFNNELQNTMFTRHKNSIRIIQGDELKYLKRLYRSQGLGIV